MNVTHELLVHADGVNLLGGNSYNKEKAEALSCASKEVSVRVNAERVSVHFSLPR